MDRRALLAGTTGGAVGLILSRRSAETADPLRLDYQVNIWGSLSVVALKSGLFEKAGLPVEGIRSPVGRQTRGAMVSGRLDFGTFAVPTFLLGADKGGLVAVALAGNAGKTVHVLVRPDSPIGIKDPFSPSEIGYFIPDPMGNNRSAQSNDVFYDDNGLL